MKVNLEEAKKKIFAENMFQNGNEFYFPCFGKYFPNLTYVMSDDWNIDEDGNPENPLERKDCPKEIWDILPLPSNLKSPSCTFGDFWMSKKGKACFRLKSPDKAKHFLIAANSKGFFADYYYREEGYGDPSKIGAVYCRLAKETEYWIFPINLIPKDYLEEIATKEEKRVQSNKEKYLAQKAEKELSASQRPLFEERLLRAHEYLKKYDKGGMWDAGIVLGEESFRWRFQDLKYFEKNVKEVEKAVERLKESYRAREKFLPQFLAEPLFQKIMAKEKVEVHEGLEKFEIVIFPLYRREFSYSEEELKKFRDSCLSYLYR